MKRYEFARVSHVITLALIAVLALSVMDAGAADWIKRQRPAQLVSENNGIYKLSNIRWGFDEPSTYDNLSPKWRTVDIDANTVKDVIFIVKPFEPEWIAAHCLLFFEFEKPVTTEFGETSNALTLSIEARLLEGQKYDLMKGNKGAFFIIYQLSSKEDYLQICSLENKRLIPYRLKLSKEQKVELFKYVLAESFKNRDNEKYNTIVNSCTNNLFIMLNQVLPKNQQFREWVLKKVLYNLSISMPRTAHIFLKRHKLVEEQLPIIKPSKDNRGDIATKQLEGPALDASMAKAKALAAKADSVKSVINSSLAEGTLPKDLFRTLFYNEEAEQVMYLDVPGTVPGERNNGEFFIGGQFDERLSQAASAGEMIDINNLAFEGYKAAIMKRMSLEGPDPTEYIAGQLGAMDKTFRQAVRYAELNQK